MRTQLFGLTDYSRVLFIDRNSLVINNPDHLFETPVPSDHPLEDSRLVFTALRQTECLGACVTAPVCQVDDKLYHENLTPEKVRALIDNLAKEDR